MKILYISKSTIPSDTANSINVMKMCEAFALLGNEVDLLAPQHSFENLVTYNPYEFYGVKKTFFIQRIKNIKKVRKSSQDYNRLFKTYIKLKHPDLVYARCNSLKYNLDELEVPLIIEIHREVKKEKEQLKRLIDSKFLKRIVVINKYLKNYYQDNYMVSEDLILVAHSGADGFVSNERIQLPETNKMRVGYAGHLYPGKGMEVITQLAKNCLWAEFHILGGTKSDLDFWEEKLNDCKNVFLYGFVPHAEINKYLNSFDILLAPYQYNIGTADGGSLLSEWISPLKVFEYMSVGKAIIASDLPSLREVLINDVNAILCKPTEIDNWIQALKYLRDNHEKRTELGSIANEEFMKKYTWKVRANNILESMNID